MAGGKWVYLVMVGDDEHQFPIGAFYTQSEANKAKPGKGQLARFDKKQLMCGAWTWVERVPLGKIQVA